MSRLTFRLSWALVGPVLLLCSASCAPQAAPQAAAAPQGSEAKIGSAPAGTGETPVPPKTEIAAAPAVPTTAASAAAPAAKEFPQTQADNSALKAANALYGGIREETLPNGMRVYLKPIPESPVVTTMVLYRVGSADEDLDHTGLSHYLEHLMFKGTEKLSPGDIDRMTLRNGGANNAYTTEDYTAFHFDFAADRWEQALDIEADRMQNLRIDAKHEFEQEKGAVIEELRQDEDQPWDLEQKAILPILFGEDSPYGHPIIGQAQHVSDATAQVIKAYYDKWYHPNNATLVVCGGFDPDKAMAKVKELFSPIAKTELPTRKVVPDETPKRPVTKQIDSKFDSPRLLMGFNTVRRDDPDYYPLEVVQGLLTGGKTGRLYQQLVEGEEVASEVQSYNVGGRYPGWFSVQVAALPDADPEAVEALVRGELRRLCEQPATELEVKRVQQMLLTSDIFDREGIHELADSIVRALAIGDLNLARNYLPGIMAVTPADVQRVAQKYLNPKMRVSVWSVPKPEEKTDEKPEKTERHATTGTRSRYVSRADRARRSGRAGRDTSAATKGGLTEARRVELPNGLVLLLLENHRLPIVAAEAYMNKVRLMEPADKAGVSVLVGDLLDEGTDKHTSAQIAEALADMGGVMAFDESGGSLKVLAGKRREGLGLFLECLASSNFPEDSFMREKEALLAEIDDAEAQPGSKAEMVYLSLVYGDHPYGRPAHGKHETVEALTREDCTEFHRQLFVPNNTLLAIVGDFDTQQMIEDVKALTADWKRDELPTVTLPTVEKPPAFKQEIIPMPQAAQTHVYLGHVGIKRDNPDYYKLEVMDHVFGTAPGFTDRLSSRLRDREGLAYSVGADITTSAAEEPGAFTCFIGTDARNFSRVKTLLLEELNKIHSEKPSDAEVDDAKQYLLGNLPFKFTTTQRIAQELIDIERFHLGLHYLEDYRKAIEAVTADDVFAVAKKYLDPARVVLVAAGAIDEEGKAMSSDPNAGGVSAERKQDGSK